MQLHELKRKHAQKSKKPRVGRAGKRGTTSGKGQKGQKARAGRRMRPAERDLYMRLPKLRGVKNRPHEEPLAVLNVGELSRFVKDGIVSEKVLGRKVKVLGDGEIKIKVTVDGLPVSKSAKQKIEAAGGNIIPSEAGKK